MSDEQAQIDAHRDRLQELCAKGGVLSEKGATATTNLPRFYDQFTGVPSFARARLIGRLREQFRYEGAENLAKDRRAIVLAGPPGAGKTSALKSAIARTGVQRSKWREINADNFKDALLLAALEDGTYDAMVPEVVKGFEEQGERFFPRELAGLVHAESSKLAASARQDAFAAGENVVIDGTLAGTRSASDLFADLQAAGYSVAVIDVEITQPLSAARIEHRWCRGYTAALEGRSSDPEEDPRGAVLGGRWVPSDFAKDVYLASGQSKAEVNAREYSASYDNVHLYQLHRVTRVDQRAADLVEEWHRTAPGQNLVQVDLPSTGTSLGGPGAGDPPTPSAPSTATSL